MRPVDCLGESRVTENVTHGSGGGSWRRRSAMVTGDGRPRETAGLSAGPTAANRASPLPHHATRTAPLQPLLDREVARLLAHPDAIRVSGHARQQDPPRP